MAKGDNRILVTFACTECKDRTYNSSKSRRNDPQRLELMKFCPICRQRKLYREVRLDSMQQRSSGSRPNVFRFFISFCSSV